MDDCTRTGSQSIDDGSPEQGGEAPRLILSFECGQPFAPACRYQLDALDEVVIGRGATRSARRTGRQLEIAAFDHEISRRHAALVRQETSWELRDLGSKNRTFVNGVACTRVTLSDGDFIETGGVIFIYRDDARSTDDITDLDLATATNRPAAFRTLDVELERLSADLTKIAPSTVPVLIRGETGTGKELTAEAIHELSGRRGRFVAVNCGALPRTLVESELFGSKRGAFSGARDDREGLVRRADGGTLFLDEIAELPEESQVALLRVLQDGEVRPIGSSESVRVDVRVVAATHQDLEARILAGKFRQDLYARLVGYVARLPALRQRREDIGSLIAAILARLTSDSQTVTLHRQAARALFAYSFPLNVRELEQALRTAVVLAEGGEVRIEHLPETIRTYRPATTTLRPEDQALRDRLAELLREHRGNVSAVARALGKAPIQIRRWCHRFALEISTFRD